MTLASTPEERAQIRSSTLKSLRRTRQAKMHRWSAWDHTGSLCTLKRRTCLDCGKIQTRDTG